MYYGKYDNRNTRSRRRRRKGKSSLLLVTMIVLACMLVGTTLAYLVANTDPVTNSFVPAKITTEITEDFKDNVKKNVQVTNTGDVDAYIRAAVVVTWQKVNDGVVEVYPTAPVEGTDYTVEYPNDTGWVKHTDGFYYFTEPLKPDGSTGILLTDCKPVEGKAPEGYHLVVEILSSAIQSEPENAIHEAWGVTIVGGKVEAYVPNTTEGGNAA